MTSIEEQIFDLAHKSLRKNSDVEIYEKELFVNKENRLHEGHIKFFGNSSVDMNIDHTPSNKVMVSIFLDNQYDDCPECFEMDKKEAQKELKDVLSFLKEKKVKYTFDSD